MEKFSLLSQHRHIYIFIFFTLDLQKINLCRLSLFLFAIQDEFNLLLSSIFTRE